MIYEKLKDVKIVYKQQTSSSAWDSWASYIFNFETPKIDTKEEKWLAVYHKEYKKWIVTDDIENTGLNEYADKIDIVGFATSLDGIMFVVWEHQKSLGMTRTIQEEIKDIKFMELTKTNKENNDWKWAKPVEEKSKINQFKSIILKGGPFDGFLTNIDNSTFKSYVDENNFEDNT